MDRDTWEEHFGTFLCGVVIVVVGLLLVMLLPIWVPAYCIGWCGRKWLDRG